VLPMEDVSTPKTREGRAATVLAVVGILLLAAVLRFARLASLPYGLHLDEAHNVLDEVTISWSHHPIFFVAKGGREALFLYWQHLFLLGLGVSTFSVRLASASVAVVSVALEFTVMRRFFGRAVGVLSALVLASLYWHVHMGRVGLRTIVMPLVVLQVMYTLRCAVLRGRARAFAFPGGVLGIAMHTYTAARLLPLVAAGYLLYVVASRPRQWRTWLGGTVIAACIWCVLVAPLAVYAIEHPDALFVRLNQTSSVDPHATVATNVAAVARNGITYARSISLFGDVQFVANVPGRPVYDPLMSLFFYGGMGLLVLYALGRRNAVARPGQRDAAVLCLLSLLVMLLPGLLSQDAPYFGRITGALPTLVVAPALAVTWLWNRARGTTLRRVALAACTVLFGVQTAGTAHDYFVTWAQSAGSSYKNSSGATAIGQFLKTNHFRGDVLISTYEPEVTRAIAPAETTNVQWFHAREWLPLPAHPDQAMTYLFEHSDPLLEPSPAERLLGTVGTRILNVTDVNSGVQTASGYHLEPGQSVRNILPQGPAATFDHRLEILGARVEADPVFPGAYTALLVLRAVRDAPGYLSVSVRAVDAAGSVWGQYDGLGTLDLSTWTAGQSALTTHPLHLLAGTPAGELRVEVRLYEVLTQAALMRDGSGDAALDVGSLRISSDAPIDPRAVVVMSQPVKRVLAGSVELESVRFGEPSVKQGGREQVDVLWRCQQTGPLGSHLDVETVDQQGAVLGVFGTGSGLAAPPIDRCPPGRLVLDRRYQQVGRRWPEGPLTVRAVVRGGTPDAAAVVLGTVNIQPLPRVFTPPPSVQPVGATFADGIELVGITQAPSPSDAGLNVTLVWRAHGSPPKDLTAFVHVIAPNGALVAQHDGPPGGGDWPITSWVDRQIVVDVHHVPPPLTGAFAGAVLEVGMYDPANSQRLRVLSGGSGQIQDQAVRLPLTY